MAQALCRLAARLAGLTLIVASRSEGVLLLSAGNPSPLIVPGAYLVRLLFWAGYLKTGDRVLSAGDLSSAVRARLAASGTVRAEFVTGAYARFRYSLLREASDFALIRARAIGETA